MNEHLLHIGDNERRRIFDLMDQGRTNDQIVMEIPSAYVTIHVVGLLRVMWRHGQTCRWVDKVTVEHLLDQCYTPEQIASRLTGFDRSLWEEDAALEYVEQQIGWYHYRRANELWTRVTDLVFEYIQEAGHMGVFYGTPDQMLLDFAMYIQNTIEDESAPLKSKVGNKESDGPE